MDTTVPALPGVGPVWPLDPALDRTSVRSLDFVEVDADIEPAADAAVPPAPTLVPVLTEPRWSLFGEMEA